MGKKTFRKHECALLFACAINNTPTVLMLRALIYQSLLQYTYILYIKALIYQSMLQYMYNIYYISKL